MNKREQIKIILEEYMAGDGVRDEIADKILALDQPQEEIEEVKLQDVFNINKPSDVDIISTVIKINRKLNEVVRAINKIK